MSEQILLLSAEWSNICSDTGTECGSLLMKFDYGRLCVWGKKL